MTVTLGINGIDGIFHDASASIVRDGDVIASVEEERFNRVKHTNGIPFNAIDFCLNKAGLNFSAVDHVGYYLDPSILKKTFFTDIMANYRCPARKIRYVTKAASRISRLKKILMKHYSLTGDFDFQFVNHHLAHAASSYYLSDFDRSSILTIDGSGERETLVLFEGRGSTISKVQDILVYPESLGFIYTVIGSHLGLGWIEGAGKLMGLAAYGVPDTALFDDVVMLRGDPSRPLQIDLSFFNYHLGGSGLSKKGIEKFGTGRKPGKPMDREHSNLAASTQLMLEKAILHVVSYVPKLVPDSRNLCLAGGVALNVVTNRSIIDTELFEHVFITPPAYDGGTSLGCALYLAANHTGTSKFRFDVYCGPDIERDYSIEPALMRYRAKVAWEKLDSAELINKAVEHIIRNEIIGWARGRMECGPRALGNRSIITNAMNPLAKEELNSRVKHRESFRPYCPSALQEYCLEWFDIGESPYMLLQARVLEGKKSKVPGIVHVDGTSRVQTVTRDQNPAYYALIKAFNDKTGVPILLNTSFNKHGEPIVNTPDDAIEMLTSTGMDALFLGDYYITKIVSRNSSENAK